MRPIVRDNEWLFGAGSDARQLVILSNVCSCLRTFITFLLLLLPFFVRDMRGSWFFGSCYVDMAVFLFFLSFGKKREKGRERGVNKLSVMCRVFLSMSRTCIILCLYL